MNELPCESRESRVLMLPPTLKDAANASKVLSASGLDCSVCNSLSELCQEIEHGVGIVIIPDGVIALDESAELARTLRKQPPWSNIPVVVLTSPGVTPGFQLRSLFEQGLVTVLRRPFDVSEFVNAVKSGLRDRDRQYQVRDHLLESERDAKALREKEERLQFALSAGQLGSWQLNLDTYELICSDQFRRHFGHSPSDPFLHQNFLTAVHPDDSTWVHRAFHAAFHENEPLDIEYRILWPDKSVHWILIRGRVIEIANARPQFASGVTLDITQRRQTEENLRDADRRKDEFLAMLAHELRNPLAPIRNGLQVMRLLGDGKSAPSEIQEMMERQVEHLSRLVEDLLDVSRITRGKVELRKSVINLTETIDRATEAVRPLIDAHHHRLIVATADSPVWAVADQTRMVQVVANLLSNAAKYSPDGSQISVTLQQTNHTACIRVRDTGTGISPEMLPRVFDMFTQLDRTLDRSEGGLGIGLTLVRSLVELHGGRVEAHSDGIGKGSEFVISLPSLTERQALAGTNGRRESQDFDRHSRRIMVVDDNVDAANSLALFLRLLGHDVRVIHDGTEVLSAANDFVPDALLLDLGLPGRDGYEVAHEIRSQPIGQHLLIVAISGYGQEDDRRRTAAAGFDYHLTKPADLESLQRVISHAQ